MTNLRKAVQNVVDGDLCVIQIDPRGLPAQYGICVHGNTVHGGCLDCAIDYLSRALVGHDAGLKSDTAEAEAWMPIDTVPKDGRLVLLYEDGDVYCDRWLISAWGYSRGLPAFLAPNPTHWAPIPEHPSERRTD